MSTSTSTRRLSARRGSVTAPDPFGVHATVNLDPNRSSSSTLTIVRVPAASAAPVPLTLNEPPASPVLNPRRLHRRIAQTPGGPPAPAEPPSNRVSFAFSSFGASGPRSSSPNPPSPSSSPRLRPSSPHLGGSSFGSGKPRLTPDQLVDLARQATIPRPQIASSCDVPTPATFTPLPDDIFLPFIDRPTEVAALISSPPDVKLFTLLAQTFAKPSSPAGDSASAVALAEKQATVDLPRDPVQWTYPQLVYHLTKIDRDIAPDFIWTIAARKCILSHSELIWERIKGALGVPPELDVEYDFLDDDQESPDTSDISDDEGRAANGHWSDWDAVMDSPMYARNPKRLSAESPVASLYFAARREEEVQFRAQMDNRLQVLQTTGYDPSPRADAETDAQGVEGTGDATIVPTPHKRSPPDQDQGGIVYGTFSPPLVTQREPTLESDPDYISIEPLLATATSPSSFNASGTSPGDGLGDIAEGAEEEEESAATESTGASSGTRDYLTANSDANSPADSDMISPSQIQGLRISTSPLPPQTVSTSPLPLAASVSFDTPPVLSPISPLPPYPSQPLQSSSSASSINNGSVGAGTHPQAIPAIPASGSYGSRPHSRTSSVSSIGPFQRSESTGNMSASWIAMAVAAAGSGSQYTGSVFGSDAGDSSGYLSDGDRGIGQPLFPSNFARLAGGPTMRANNPATRGPNAIPHTRYKSGGSTRSAGGGKKSASARATPATGPSAGPNAGLSAAEKRLSWGAGSVSSATGAA